MTLFAPPAPAGSLGPQDVAEAAANFRPGFGEYLGASLREGFWSTLAGQGRAQMQIGGAQARAEVFGTNDQLALEEDDWKAGPWFRDRLRWRPGLTAAEARAQAEIFDQNAIRRWMIERRQAGFFGQVAGFGAGVLGSIPTPENFLPIAGPALAVARAGYVGGTLARLAAGAEARRAAGSVGARAAVGAGMGAVDAFGGTALSMPLLVAGREALGDEVGWGEILLDLALGAVAGGVIGGVGGAGGAMLDRSRNRASLAASVPQQDAALLAMSKGADDVAQGLAPDLAGLPVRERLMLEELRRRAAEQQAEIGRLQQRVAEGTGSGTIAATAAARVQGEAAPAEIVAGQPQRVTVPGGREIQVRYQVVELQSLVASNRPDGAANPDFPGELQPRDRSTPEQRQWVMTEANRLRPEVLAISPETSIGAPIVGPDNIVESGNGRVLLVGRAYGENLPTGQAYRAYIESLGFGTEGMQQPVLIRRRLTDLDMAGRRNLAAEANAPTTARMTEGEAARVDARRLGGDVMARWRGGEMDSAQNGDFVRAFLDGLPATERTDLSGGGTLNKAGFDRLRGALVARAYADPDLVRRLVETPEAKLSALDKALVQAAPDVASLRAAVEDGRVNGALDGTDSLIGAIRQVADARAAGRPLDQLLTQADMLGGGPTPAQRAWLGLLLRPDRRGQVGTATQAQVAERIAAVMRHAMESPTGPDMLGNPPPGFRDVMAAAWREAGLDTDQLPRALDADPAVPRDPIAAEAAEPLPEPPPILPDQADPLAAAAARMGFDLSDAQALIAAAEKLRADGRLDEAGAAHMAEADAAVAKAEAAHEAHQAAATCVLEAA